MRRWERVLSLFAAVICATVARDGLAADKPLVVSSIRPLHLILLAVAGDAVDARVLPAVQGTAHDFVLRPSDLRLLREADQVFWVGPVLERPLGEFLRRWTEPARVAALFEQVVEPGASGMDRDPHVWLDPRNATRIAVRMADVLERRGLVQRGSLASRVDAFVSEMKATEVALQDEFAPVRGRPFFVMHDGYAHFVHRFGLNQAGAVALNEEHSPGARTLHVLRSRLRAAGAVCLVTEPGVNPSLLRALADGSHARVLALDPLAFDAPVTTHGFATFLRDIGHRLAHCLASGIQETPADE